MRSTSWIAREPDGSTSMWTVTVGSTVKEIAQRLVDEGRVTWRKDGKPDRRFVESRLVARIFPGLTRRGD